MDHMPVSFYSYSNLSSSEGNTCGQAAIAAIADFFDCDIGGLKRTVRTADGRLHWRNDDVVGEVYKRFPPDNVFGAFGTSGELIQRALRAYGLDGTDLFYTGLTTPWQRCWDALREAVTNGWPSAVLVQQDLLPGWAGSGFLNVSAHWPVVFRIDARGVHLANCGKAPVIMSVDDFLRAWNYTAFNPVTYKNNHCAVVPYRKPSRTGMTAMSVRARPQRAESTGAVDVFVIESPQPEVAHFLERCPALLAASYTVAGDRADVVGEAVETEAHGFLRGCRTCLRLLESEAAGNGERARRTQHFDGRGFALRIYKSRIEIERKAAFLQPAEVVSLRFDEIDGVEPSGGGMLGLISPPTLTFVDTAGAGVPCVFGSSAARDEALERVQEALERNRVRAAR